MTLHEPPVIHRLMKCSDIEDWGILIAIANSEYFGSLGAKLYDLAGVMWESAPDGIICEGTQNYAELKVLPYNLVKAKMRRLIKRGLVNGCACGCRGDFTLTEKGKQYIDESSVTEKL